MDRVICDIDTFIAFINVVQANYNDVPYHSYAHAVDVLHTVFRLVSLTEAPRWLGAVDQYALLCAALCHDLGHEGRTNPFLVEIGHDLALRYNDKSPLENMHCAKLFEISSKDATDIFKSLETSSRRLARKVCISAILHTDNVNHFEMVKDVTKVYEISSEICDIQAAYQEEGLWPQYEQTVLNSEKDRDLYLQLFLHLADCSNPLKPFLISEKWANNVLKEFFAKGDEEKKLGLPIGLL